MRFDYVLTEGQMQYLLLIYSEETAWSEEERRRCYADSAELAMRLHQEGKCIATAPLESVSVATSVRVRGGKTQVIDGPLIYSQRHKGEGNGDGGRESSGGISRRMDDGKEASSGEGEGTHPCAG
jgi:hypothetical protein